MSRDIAFDEDAICDGCGATGAFDFMGDFFCEKCLLQMADEDVEEWDDE
jgi:pyruvate/2-oxoacid:ferredoxin oxidoreductase beta subunit